MVFVIEASLAIRHVFEVNFALVTHSINIGGAIRPGHTGHTATRLIVPATNVHYLSHFSLPTYTQTHIHTNNTRKTHICENINAAACGKKTLDVKSPGRVNK